MNLIFLDFDEVINSIYYRYTQKMDEGFEPFLDLSLEKRAKDIDPINLQFLNELIKESDAKIVISSTWRKLSSVFGCSESEKIENFTKLFTMLGYSHWSVIGSTPITNQQRGYEVALYLEDFIQKEKLDNYLILDNGADFFIKSYKDWSEKDWASQRTKDGHEFTKEWYIDKCEKYPNIWDKQKMLRTNPMTGLSADDIMKAIAHFNKEHLFYQNLVDHEKYRHTYKLNN